jgi:hypothetical protein
MFLVPYLIVGGIGLIIWAIAINVPTSIRIDTPEEGS